MKSRKVSKLLLSVALGAACVLGLASCAGGAGGTGSVAATVNGSKIMEDDVTSYITEFRKNNGLEEDAAWISWMTAQGMTPETVREQVIDMFKFNDLMKQAAKDKGISIPKAEVDAQVDSMKANYPTEEDWEAALAQVGTSESEYRESIEVSMLQKKLQEAVLEETSPEPATDEELIQYLGQYAPQFDGAKRSSHILFNAEDEAKAQEVLDRINSGELDFAEAAKQYSNDTASAENGGDVGWDKLNSFVAEYTDALGNLGEGQVSELVTSDFGIHIIKCTEVFVAPESITALDQVPSALVDYVRNIVNENLQSSEYADWIADYEEKAEITVNEMPSGLPYDVSDSNEPEESQPEEQPVAEEESDSNEDAGDQDQEPAEPAEENAE